MLVEVKLRFGGLIVGLELLITGLDLAGIEIIGIEACCKAKRCSGL